MIRNITVIASALTLLINVAWAQCSSLPYTLTNGQNADANQVMANFSGILSCGRFTGGDIPGARWISSLGSYATRDGCFDST